MGRIKGKGSDFHLDPSHLTSLSIPDHSATCVLPSPVLTHAGPVRARDPPHVEIHNQPIAQPQTIRPHRPPPHPTEPVPYRARREARRALQDREGQSRCFRAEDQVRRREFAGVRAYLR